MIWVYCKTHDNPKNVGKYICKSNFFQEINPESRILKEGFEEDCWIIENYSNNETSAMIYRVREEVVVVEIDDECAVNVIEPLIRKYGFDNVKWLVIKEI